MYILRSIKFIFSSNDFYNRSVEGSTFGRHRERVKHKLRDFLLSLISYKFCFKVVPKYLKFFNPALIKSVALLLIFKKNVVSFLYFVNLTIASGILSEIFQMRMPDRCQNCVIF